MGRLKQIGSPFCIGRHSHSGPKPWFAFCDTSGWNTRTYKAVPKRAATMRMLATSLRLGQFMLPQCSSVAVFSISFFVGAYCDPGKNSHCLTVRTGLGSKSTAQNVCLDRQSPMTASASSRQCYMISNPFLWRLSRRWKRFSHGLCPKIPAVTTGNHSGEGPDRGILTSSPSTPKVSTITAIADINVAMSPSPLR